MATAVGDLGRERRRPLFARRLSLRPGEQDFALRKNRRQRVLRPKHVLALLALQAVLFVGVREAYLFLITWEELAIRKVTVMCPKPDLKQAIENYYAVPRLGNILLCNLQAVRADIRRLAWVKDVSLQKVFPSTIRIAIATRTPFAILERDGLRLVDEEGHALERVYSLQEYGLPVISDANGFASGYFEKWEGASRCINGLPPSETGRLLGVRCSDYGTLELTFKNDPVRVIVGCESPAEDLAMFRSRRREWEGLLGPLASVNVSFDGRVFLRAAEPAGADVPQPDKGD